MPFTQNPLPSILIHCQYVYGIGHFVRTIELASRLSSRFDVYLVNGGEAIPNYDIPLTVNYIQLPAIYKDETADCLTPVDTSQNIDECFQLRESTIRHVVETIKPDILITEHFPFGLLFETEVMGLIAKVREENNTVKIVCSVRDVIESGEGGERDDYTCSILNRWYDMVLVHGDGTIVPFVSSFPCIECIKIPIHQTGYVVKPIPVSPKPGLPVLLVSVGGGRLGSELLTAVLNAHTTVLERWNHNLVLFSGAFQQDLSDLYGQVRNEKNSQVVLHKFDRSLYRQTLGRASAIMCLGGYNSLIEAVSSQEPVLIYNRKFHGKNKEQDLRSSLFERKGFIRTISSEDLNKERLSGLILDTIASFQTPDTLINYEGAENSLRKLLEIQSGYS